MPNSNDPGPRPRCTSIAAPITASVISFTYTASDYVLTAEARDAEEDAEDEVPLATDPPGQSGKMKKNWLSGAHVSAG